MLKYVIRKRKIKSTKSRDEKVSLELAFEMEHYGTLIVTPTPGIQWYKFRPPGVTPNRGMGPL